MSKTCVVILDNLRSVENTGSIFRTAEGLGLAKVICVGTTPTPLDRFGRKRTDLAKVSLGAEEMLEWEYREEISEVLEELKEQHFQIIVLEQTEHSVDLHEFKTKPQFALIVGNEVEGVSKEALDLADATLEIPMQGRKESFNASVATGMALYQLMLE